MKQKNLVMLGVAVGCGLVAAIAVAKLSAGAGRGPDTVKVLVAKKDIPLQTKLEEKDLDNLLVWADMPKSLAPPDAATDLEQVKGKSLNRTLKQGNAVSLGDVGTQQTIVIPEGFKSITVKATQVDAAGGFAKPGANVDIMYIERTGTGKARAAIILRDMLVLAVNAVHTLDEKTGAAMLQVESVSFAVKDKQATLLSLADERGKLKLLLKGQGKADAEKNLNEAIKWEDDPFAEASAIPASSIAAPPTAKMDTIVVARKPVPVNALINADNVGDYFTTVEVKTAPEGVVTNSDNLKGKFIVKAVDEGQLLYKSLTADATVDFRKPVDPTVTPAPTPKPATLVTEKKKYPRYDQVIYQGGRTERWVWMNVAPETEQGKWKRFANDKEADEYKPRSSDFKDDAKESPKLEKGSDSE
jgi:pilus assembly protein CpaB